MKYNLTIISKTLDKLFKAGFNNEKIILNMKMEDLQKIQDITSLEMNIIIDFKKAIKDKNIVNFLNCNRNLIENNKK